MNLLLNGMSLILSDVCCCNQPFDIRQASLYRQYKEEKTVFDAEPARPEYANKVVERLQVRDVIQLRMTIHLDVKRDESREESGGISSHP